MDGVGQPTNCGDPAEAALDSNAFSDWDAQTGSATPASITIDMRAPQVVSGLIYEPPQTPSPVGAIGQYKVSVSNDDVNFTTVATGTWANTTAVKQVGFDPADTRFVRLTALSTAAGTGTVRCRGRDLPAGRPHVSGSRGVDQADELMAAQTAPTLPWSASGGRPSASPSFP